MKFRIQLMITQGALICLSLAFMTTAHAQKIVVQEAIPNSAERETVNLDVLIKGRGFSSGANVAFWVTGTTNPGGITVNGVTVHGSKSLTANINVAADADIADFDIEVQSLSGRKGRGTTLFSVKQKGGQTADTTAPSLITDFQAFLPTSDMIRLGWTHSGDDGDEGYADHYILLQAEQVNLSDCSAGPYDFLNAVQLDAPDPRAHGGGGGHEFWAEGLNPETCYAFSVQPFDEAGNTPGASSTAALTMVALAEGAWDKELIPPGTYWTDLALDDTGEPRVFGSSRHVSPTGYLFFARSQSTTEWTINKVVKGKGTGRVDLAYNSAVGTFGGIVLVRNHPIYVDIQSDGSSNTTQITGENVGGIRRQVLAFDTGGNATVVLDINGVIYLARQNGSSFDLEMPPIPPGSGPLLQFDPDNSGDLSIAYNGAGGIQIATFDASEIDASENAWSAKSMILTNSYGMFDFGYDPNSELVIIYREQFSGFPSGQDKFMRMIRADTNGNWNAGNAVTIDPNGLANQNMADMVHTADGTLYVAMGNSAAQLRVGRFCEAGRGFSCEASRPTVDDSGQNVWLWETPSEFAGGPGIAIAIDDLTGDISVITSSEPYGGNQYFSCNINTASVNTASVICGNQ